MRGISSENAETSCALRPSTPLSHTNHPPQHTTPPFFLPPATPPRHNQGREKSVINHRELPGSAIRPIEQLEHKNSKINWFSYIDLLNSPSRTSFPIPHRDPHSQTQPMTPIHLKLFDPSIHMKNLCHQLLYTTYPIPIRIPIPSPSFIQ